MIKNERIAKIFHEIHRMEKRGRGIGLILSKELDADFKEIGTQLIVTLKRKYLEEGEEKVGETLTQNQEMILSLIRETPQISVRELSDKVGISARKVEENISKLKKKSLLKRIGPARGGHWEVLEK
jgi:ATP-dependent DNA helicase RecG